MTEQLLLSYSLALILNDKNEVLLQYRINSKWFADQYGLIGGTINYEESAIQALQREAFEEIDITISNEDCELVHVMHFRGEDKPCVAFFFKVSKWQGIIFNKEPDKHEHLKWFSLNNLPTNLIPRHKKALEMIIKDQIYSEDNW